MGIASNAACKSPADSAATGVGRGRTPLENSSTSAGMDATAPGSMLEQPRIVSNGAPSHIPRVEATGGSAWPSRYGVSGFPECR